MALKDGTYFQKYEKRYLTMSRGGRAVTWGDRKIAEECECSLRFAQEGVFSAKGINAI